MSWHKVWTIWTLAAAGSFIALELWSVLDRKGITLSQFTWRTVDSNLEKALLLGFLVWLTLHLRWRWL
jgi:hypothetical protein